MPYTTPVTATAGQPLPAADWNAGVRDNLTILGTAWTAYTPTWASSGVTQPVLGNGTIAGRYRTFGKTMDLRILVTMGTTTTYGVVAWTLSLPSGVTASAVFALNANFISTGHYHGIGSVDAGAGVVVPLVDNGTAGGALQLPTSTVPFAWANAHRLLVHGTIEIT